MSGNAECGGGATAVLDNWEEMDDTDLNSKLKQLKTSNSTNPTRTTPQPSQPQSHSNSSNNISSSSSATSSAPARNISGILSRPTASAVVPNGSSTSPSPAGLDASHDSWPTLGTGLPLLPSLQQKDEDYGGHSRPRGAAAAGLVEPIVKILRRPEHERTSPVVNDRPRQPVKTLQQREQEYAEARLRILGAAQNPEEKPDGQTPAAAASPSAASATVSASSNESSPRWSNQHHHNHQHNYAGNSNGTNGPSIRRPPLLAHTPILTAAAAAGGSAAGIVRQPRGPDDMAGGFAFRR